MSYVETGKTFRLGPQDTMVLSYLDSCLRETITGGTVIVGIDHSEVQGGKVTRTKLDCGSNLFELTGSTAQVAGRALRGLPRPETEPSRGGILVAATGYSFKLDFRPLAERLRGPKLTFETARCCFFGRLQKSIQQPGLAHARGDPFGVSRILERQTTDMVRQ